MIPLLSWIDDHSVLLSFRSQSLYGTPILASSQRPRRRQQHLSLFDHEQWNLTILPVSTSRHVSELGPFSTHRHATGTRTTILTITFLGSPTQLYQFQVLGWIITYRQKWKIYGHETKFHDDGVMRWAFLFHHAKPLPGFWNQDLLILLSCQQVDSHIREFYFSCSGS